MLVPWLDSKRVGPTLHEAEPALALAKKRTARDAIDRAIFLIVDDTIRVNV
jgi:hypothetical protein